jgi:DNA repair ATPase RecN
MESKIESLNFSELTELDKKNDEIKKLEEVKEDWFKTDQEIEEIKKQIEKLKSQANDIGKREIVGRVDSPFSTYKRVTPKLPELSSNQIDQSGQAQRIKIDLFLGADAQLVANLRDAHNVNVELTTVANTV